MNFTRRQALFTASAAALAGCASASNSSGGAQGAALAAFFEEAFEQSILASPQFATTLGDRRGYGRWDDPSDAAARAQLDARLASRDEMRARFNPATLSPADRLSYRLYDHGATRAEENWRWRNHGYIFNHMGGAQTGTPSFLISQHTVNDVADAEAYVSRLNGAAMAEVARSGRGVRAGIAPAALFIMTASSPPAARIAGALHRGPDARSEQFQGG